MFGWFKSKKASKNEAAPEVSLEEKEKEEALRLVRLESAVYESLKYYTMCSDLKVIEEKMDALEPEDTAQNNKIEKFINENITNRIRRENALKLSGKKSEIKARINAFTAAKKEAGIDLSLGESEEPLKAAINELFAKDENGLGRTLFALRLATDNTVEYEDKEASLEKVSSLLFGDSEKIAVLENDLKDSIKFISQGGALLGENNALAIGLGAMTALCVFGAPLTLAAGALAGTADTLLTIATGTALPIFTALGIASVTVDAATAAVFVLTSAVAGSSVARFVKDQKTKEAIANLSLEDYIVLLALKATLVKEAKRTLARDAFKEVLDEHLRSVDDLRADAEYNWIVEKENAPAAKAKVTACNRFTERMGIIVGI